VSCINFIEPLLYFLVISGSANSREKDNKYIRVWSERERSPSPRRIYMSINMHAVRALARSFDIQLIGMR
jgi:hypothetical protein